MRDLPRFLLPSLVLLLGVSADGWAARPSVVFFIGDGMGLAQISAARFQLKGSGGRLSFEALSVTGLVDTSSADRLVTDSAAASTALACGRKTDNGKIGMTPEGLPLTSILDLCRQAGMSAGLVATSSLTHATPAGFASVQASRKDEDQIAPQLISRGAEVLLGGGTAFFQAQSVLGSKRKDEEDLLARARSLGYALVQDRGEMTAAKGPKLLGLFAPEGLVHAPEEPSLAEMTAKALEVLSQDPDGFFLMVEGSQIDWACHANDAVHFMREMAGFDAAVAQGLSFAARSKDLLVLVTADHETGSLSISGGGLKPSPPDLLWGSKEHSAIPVPIYAQGPGAERFGGLQDNTEIPKKIAAILGLDGLD